MVIDVEITAVTWVSHMLLGNLGVIYAVGGQTNVSTNVC